MDPVYLNWIWILLVGAVLGVFIKPHYLAILTAILEVAAIAGLAVSGEILHNGKAMLFGVAAMAIPLLGGLATCGAFVGATIRRRLVRRARADSP